MSHEWYNIAPGTHIPRPITEFRIALRIRAFRFLLYDPHKLVRIASHTRVQRALSRAIDEHTRQGLLDWDIRIRAVCVVKRQIHFARLCAELVGVVYYHAAEEVAFGLGDAVEEKTTRRSDCGAKRSQGRRSVSSSCFRSNGKQIASTERGILTRYRFRSYQIRFQSHPRRKCRLQAG